MKIVFTAELSFESNTAVNEEKAFQELRDGMSRWPSQYAPHVTINITGATHDGIPYEDDTEI